MEKEFLYREYLTSLQSLKDWDLDEKEFILIKHKRKMALIIWEQVMIETGFISEELMTLIESGKTYAEVGTKEHRNSGVMIRNLLFDTDKVFSREEFFEIMDECRKVNLTTKKENKELEKHQNGAKFGEHRECYKNAGVKLIKFNKVRNGRKKVWMRAT